MGTFPVFGKNRKRRRGMIRCVAFDFDGTLVDSNRIKLQTFHDVVAGIEGGGEVMARVLDEAPGDRHAIFARFAEVIGSSRPLQNDCPEQRRQMGLALAAEYTRRCEDAVAACPEIPGASALLDRLREQGIVVAINSATPEQALLPIVARRRWGGVFACVSGGPGGKATNLEKLSAATGFARGEIAMVGDQEADRIGAAEFGCRFIALQRPESNFALAPECSISELKQLPGLIDRLCGVLP